MGRESSFQSSVLKYLNQLPGCKAENVSGSASQSGRPDINGCYKGRMFKLELKTPDHEYKPSKKQSLELRKWKNVGCVVAVAYDLEFIKFLFGLNWEYASQGADRSHNGCTSWYDIPAIKDRWI